MKKKENYLALQKTQYMDPKDLIPYKKNARRHGSEIEILCNNIREHKFDEAHAIVVDKNHVIICGHGRRLAAMKLGMTSVPVLVRDDLDVKKTRTYRLSDNKISDMSGWDFDFLDEELMELDDMGIDMTQFGFEDMSVFEEPEEPEVEQTEGIEHHPDVGSEPQKTFKLVVICADGADLQNLYEDLTEKGYKCHMQ